MTSKSFMVKTFLIFLKNNVLKLKTSGALLSFFSFEAFSQELSQNLKPSLPTVVFSLFAIIIIFGTFLAIKRKSKNYFYFTLYTVSLFVFTFIKLETFLSFCLLLTGLFLWIPKYLNWEDNFPVKSSKIKALPLIPLALIPLGLVLPLQFFGPLTLTLAFLFCGLFVFSLFKEEEKTGIQKITISSSLLVLLCGHLMTFSKLLKTAWLIGTGIHLALLFLGLINDLVNKLGKKIQKEKKLLESNDELSTQLMIEGINLSTAHNQLGYILENMRQAFFIVDEGMIINHPISQFSEDLFGTKILGKNIFETIFKDMDRNSQQYSVINFCWATIFDSDETQWIMVENQFPSKTIIEDPKGRGERILKVSYYPIWNEQELLSNMMFVIDDITEMEAFAEKMKYEQESSNKRLTILHELTSNKRSTLKPFFHHLTENIREALYWIKSIKDQYNEKKPNLDGLETFFKLLHIIKGSSRQFSFSYISNKTHEVETTLSKIYQKIEEEKNPSQLFYQKSQQEFEDLVQETYDLVGIVGHYIQIGNTLLSLEFPEDLESLNDIHDNFKVFELFIFKLFQGQKYSLKNTEEVLASFKVKRENQGKFNTALAKIEKVCLNMRDLGKILNEEAITQSSEKIIEFINTVTNERNKKKELEEVFITNSFIDPVQKIREEQTRLFCSSKSLQKKTFSLSEKNSWLDMISLTYYETKTLLHKEKVGKTFMSPNIDNLKTLFKRHHFDYLGGMIKIIESIVVEGDLNTNYREIKFSLRKIWDHFALIFRFDFDHSKWDTNKGEIFQIDKYLKNEYAFRPSLFDLFLKKIGINKEVSYIDFRATMIDLYSTEKEDIDYMFLPDKNFKDYYVDLGRNLSERLNNTTVQNFKSNYLTRKDFSVFKLIEESLADEKFSWINYHKNVDLYKLFRAYFNIYQHKDLSKKPDTLEVLTKNFEESKTYLKNLFKGSNQEKFTKIDTAFEKLLGIPVKYSLSKCHNLVEDISNSLRKKIQLKISGDEGSLGPSQFNQLQDALVHILRNSMDHGIESPDERIDKGKKEVGTIEIICEEYQKDNLKVTVKDDGQGIKVKNIERKAIKTGTRTQDELDEMSDEEKINLIFLPNFSTKEEVTDISGRGFGMDVVKSNLEKIGADLEVSTKEEEGTTF
ncbi:MAG: ATP-binding protein, partial [Bdellovibrionota bacterium]|nr:ATP-binding protein [Bdellovibrionota bacterium]